MLDFSIPPVDPQGVAGRAREYVDSLAKPCGSLGRLESLAVQVATIQQTLKPTLRNPHNLLFSADHGIEREGVSQSPRDVTWKQTIRFTQGRTGIGFFCEQHGFTLMVVDAGVDYDFPAGVPILDRKIAHGTQNFLHGPAMTEAQCTRALEEGAAVTDLVFKEGCNVVSFGEMGIGNTSASAMWAHLFTGVPLADFVGPGSGLNPQGVAHKLDVLTRALRASALSYPQAEPLEVLRYFGGFEMVMAVGAMVRAAQHRMVLLIDGIIMSACILAASRLAPGIEPYAIFGHRGGDRGHKHLLDTLQADPILSLEMRLGEGTGALCAYPIVDSAVRMINTMAPFAETQIDCYF